MPVIKSQFTLRLLVSDHAKIKKIAEMENRSLTNMIETLVKQKIREYEQENGEIILTDEDLSVEWRTKGRTTHNNHKIIDHVRSINIIVWKTRFSALRPCFFLVVFHLSEVNFFNHQPFLYVTILVLLCQENTTLSIDKCVVGDIIFIKK